MPTIDLGKVVAGPVTTNVLWTGTDLLAEGTVIQPTKKLSECANGWTLVFSKYESGVGSREWGYHYIHLDKHSVITGGDMYIGIPAGVPEGAGGWGISYKQIRVNDGSLEGASGNNTGHSEFTCLRNIIEW